METIHDYWRDATLTLNKAVIFAPSESLQMSGVQVLASRWSKIASNQGWISSIAPPPQPNNAGVSLNRLLQYAINQEQIVVVLGLPAAHNDAQTVIDILSRTPARVILLWERAAHTQAGSHHGLNRLDGVREAWVLNPLLRSSVQAVLPNAKVEVAILGIPDVFFIQRPRDVSRRPYATFLGRFSVSKGAPMLAEEWARSVYPSTGIPLVLVGKGMSDGPGETAITALGQRSQGIRAVRLMSEGARATVLANSFLGLFPASDDYLPQALAETLAVATPVAMTDIAGHRPLATPHRAALILHRDLRNLRDVVDEILNNPLATEQRTRRGYNSVRAKHSEIATARRLNRLLWDSSSAP